MPGIAMVKNLFYPVQIIMRSSDELFTSHLGLVIMLTLIGMFLLYIFSMVLKDLIFFL